MRQDNVDKNVPTLEQLASEVILLVPEDGASRLRVERLLRELAQAEASPEAVRELAWQALVLAQGLLQSKDSEVSLQKLNELVERMMQLEREAATEATVVPNEDKPASAPDACSAPVDDGLIGEFLSKQESVLEEFESACLALEGGDASVLAAIKRQIHTWKGEAGILGFLDLAEAMHQIEEALQDTDGTPPGLISDVLLAVKDQLAAYFRARPPGSDASLDVSALRDRLKARAPEAEAAPAGTGRDFVMPAEIDLDLMQEFRAEAVEHIQQAEVSLMALESDPGDSESVNTVFRAFHTIKGVAGFVGIACITEVAHKSETFFDRFRKGTLVMHGAYTDLAFEALDMLKVLLGKLNDAVAAGHMPLPQTYDDLLHRLENVEQLEKEGVGQTLPPVQGKVGEILVREGKATPEDVAQALSKQAGGDTRLVGEILVEQQAARAQDVAHALRSQQPSAGREGEPEGMVKISTVRLDNLINMVGELVIVQSMVSQDPYVQDGANPRLARNVSQLSKITRSMQELTLAMRMVSVKPTFQKMARLVRDLARKSRKEIVFETAGEETELDRNMVEAIADPLVHMVRNAADHGIESPEERERLGKSRQGRILLRAAHEGGSVMITLRDDGRGLDRQRIMAKAVERGLVEAGAQLSDHEIHNLVFMPGFSTAEKVTDVSGRGVGMDVVRTNVEALRGTVEIHSEQGMGSTFCIRLPLTLAIIDGMVIRVGAERFILPTIAITETCRPRHEDVSTIQGQTELVMLRGDLIPLSRLHRLFGISGGREEICEAILVVTESKGQRIALMVDEILGQQQVVIKSLGSIFGKVDGVSGGAILGDGRVSLILDVDGLIRLSLN
jgi:two-component system chemotaxis sensor kinase CheA